MATKKVFNPIVPPFDTIQNDLADLATKNHSDLDQLTWSTAGHTIDTDIDLAGNDLLNVGTLNINATSDHTIASVSDDLVFTNPNSDKDFIFNVNDGGITHNFLTIDSSNLMMRISNDAATIANINGIIRVTGTWSGNAAAMYFDPTWTSGSFFGFDVKPNINTTGLSYAFVARPQFGNNNRNFIFSRFEPEAHTVGFNDVYTRYTEVLPNQFFAFAANDASSVTYNGFQIGSAITLGDGGFTNVSFTEQMIKLTGGSVRAFGVNGSISQKGLVFSGFGTIASNTTVKALEANGGIFHFYDNTYLELGTGGDARIYYDATDLVLDPQLVGTGGVKIPDGDLFFTGDGSGLPYGDMSAEDNATATTIAASGTWYQVTVFDTDVEENDANVDHTNDHITIGKAGRYYIALSGEAESGAVNDEYEIAIYKNNGTTQLTGLRTKIFFDFATSEPSVGLQGIADLANGDTIEVWVKNNTAGNNITFAFLNLSLFMLGGT